MQRAIYVQPEPLSFDPLIHPRPAKCSAIHAPLDETVGLIDDECWSIGSLMFCKKFKDEKDMPPDVVCSWSDNGATYGLLKRTPPKLDLVSEGNHEAGAFGGFACPHHGIWNLSPGVFCRVKFWSEGLTTEASTIRFVNKHVPSVPTEEILYDWVDRVWNKTVIITRAVPGTVYKDAWLGFTTEQKLHVADQVAEHCRALAELTSDYVETVEGTGIDGMFSLRERECLPHWIPRVEPRVARDDYLAYLKRLYGVLDVPGAGEPLVLQHPDLSPGNFFVTTPSDPKEMPKVTGLIDWEHVGYNFKWQVSSRPRGVRDFRVYDFSSNPDLPNRNGTDWQWMLSNACVREGFPLELEVMFDSVKEFVICYPGTQAKNFICSENLPTQEVSD
ncbi:uncharacterized protein BP5553_08253 [Venustampulla echinocandica]|uniref:Uncharacterized protein n=1 Tax=Venustampulla echinocandica TaxID=2656787 RepID=A0A370TG74_9HELO|nr:uncharacterized protein BP5553_08253 [Venustampulla echinocandica]RDL33885.1 hypothetical protein BP5553_08253 [Venustampulla echinocandica]